MKEGERKREREGGGRWGEEGTEREIERGNRKHFMYSIFNWKLV